MAEKRRSIILMIDGLFAPCGDGATKRFVEIAHRLHQLNLTVWVVLAHRGWSNIELLSKFPFNIILVSVDDYYITTKPLMDIIDSINPDFIQCKEPEILASLVFRDLIPANTRLIFDCHDVKEHRKMEDMFACMISDITICVSQKEADDLVGKEYLDKESVRYIPHSILETEIKTPMVREEVANLAFLGHLFYQPNIDALEWIASHLMPALCKEYPNLVLNVYGHYPATVLKNKWAHNCKFHGFVENLSESLRMCDLGISVVFTGSGTRIKTFDYIVSGIPFVANELGFQGMGDISDIEIGSDVCDLVKLSLRFIKEKGLRERFINKCQVHLKKNFSESAIKSLFQYTYLDFPFDRKSDSFSTRIEKFCVQNVISNSGEFLRNLFLRPQPWMKELIEKKRFNTMDNKLIKPGEWYHLNKSMPEIAKLNSSI